MPDLRGLAAREAVNVLTRLGMTARMNGNGFVIEQTPEPGAPVIVGETSVRVPRLIGAHRMADMMLTGRVVGAEEGQALGLSHYLVGPGEGLARALELAQKIAANSPVTNFAVLQALPRIAAANPAEGYLMESLVAALAGSSEQAQQRMQAFLQGRGGRVQQ